MTIQDVEYIQELERRITAIEGSMNSNVDILTIIFLVLAIALFIGSIVCYIVLYSFIRKYV